MHALNRHAFGALALLCPLLVGAVSQAGVPYVFKHDQFAASLSGAVAGVSGGQYYVQPGYVEGEAFGQVYAPDATMYPIDITGFDFVLAAPPNQAPGADYTARAWIEIYNSTSNTADPGGAPIFTMSTDDLMNQATGVQGVPLVGNTAITVKFDMSDPANHPPLITQGKIWLVIRYAHAAADMSQDWGTIACSILQLGDLGQVGCGCEPVGTVHDSDGIVPRANVMNIITPVGTCSGSRSWLYMEDAGQLASGFTIDGDILLRLKADVAAAPCVGVCDGLECGDDGCGGSCGTCGNDERCHEGQCVACIADCNGKECGSDGCGGTCGNCKTAETCDGSGQCVASCAPSCAGRACGSDGCGGTCGNCDASQECINGACEQACVPACGGRACGADGCGGSCGTCDLGESCNAGGFCVAGCAPSCSGRDCGDDGCGGSCGTCAVGACTNGVCGPDCEPFCDGKTCGNDGCGGSCGTCSGGATCSAAGVCEGAAATLAVLDISPDFGTAGVETPVSITGTGFVAGAVVKLGATALTNVVVTGSSLLSATVPAGLAPGTYTVIVVNPDGALAQKVDAFEVRAQLVAGNSSGCEGGPASGLGLALAMAGGLVWRSLRRQRGE